MNSQTKVVQQIAILKQGIVLLGQNKGLCDTMGIAIYINKYLKAKEELWKFKYFTMQKYNLQKKFPKKNQNASRYHNSITNLNFQHKPKYHLSKILI
jgi:hypothetical protein